MGKQALERRVVITGAGLVSPLGSSAQDVITRLSQDYPSGGIDWDSYSPYGVRPARARDTDKFLRRPGEKRVMSDMMLHAIEAAGQALTSSGLMDEKEALAEIHMLVAAGMSARDSEADARLISEALASNRANASFNRLLQSELKPTLFLAQLSNLVAGNLSLMFGIKGSSRTISGEELAGAKCLDTAFRQIACGQRDVMLVGGTFSAERPEIIASYASGGLLARSGETDAGAVLSTCSVFFVLESASSAQERGRQALAQICDIQVALSDRPGVSPPAERALKFAAGNGSRRPLAVVDGAPCEAHFSGETAALIHSLRSTQEIDYVGRFNRARHFGHPVDVSPMLSMWLGLSMLGHSDFPLEDSNETLPVAVLCCDWGLQKCQTAILLEKVP